MDDSRLRSLASQMINDPTAIVCPRKIASALHRGNMDGVRRLAKFVCASSNDPWVVYEACQLQRLQGLSSK